MLWCHRLPPPGPNFLLSYHERHCRGWAAISPQSGWGAVTPHRRPAATEAVYLTEPQEFSYVFMHYAYVTAIESTSSNPASWCQPASPCKGIPLSLLQVAHDIGVCACEHLKYLKEAQPEELDAFCIWEFSFAFYWAIRREVEGSGVGLYH